MDVFRGGLVILVLVDDVLTYRDALITDENRRSRDQLPYVILAFVAKRATQDIVAIFLQWDVLFEFSKTAETHVHPGF